MQLLFGCLPDGTDQRIIGIDFDGVRGKPVGSAMIQSTPACNPEATTTLVGEATHLDGPAESWLSPDTDCQGKGKGLVGCQSMRKSPNWSSRRELS